MSVYVVVSIYTYISIYLRLPGDCANELTIRIGIATLLYAATGGGVGSRPGVTASDIVVTKLDEAAGLTTVEMDIEIDGDDNAAMADAVQAELAALSNAQLAAAVGATRVASTSAPLVVEAPRDVV